MKVDEVIRFLSEMPQDAEIEVDYSGFYEPDITYHKPFCEQSTKYKDGKEIEYCRVVIAKIEADWDTV